MRVCVPFTELQPATRICLLPYQSHAMFIPVTTYRGYWAQRWAERQTFINVEHDVVFWPGALEHLWDCRHPWCAFGYHVNDCFADGFAYLGCMKVGREVIAATPGLWEPADDDWLTCDKELGAAAAAVGVHVHQHFPGVVNANPVLLA